MEAALGLIRLRDLEVDYGAAISGKVTWKNLNLPKGSPVTLVFLLGKNGAAHAFLEGGQQWLVGSMMNTVASTPMEKIITGLPSKALFPGEWDVEAVIGVASGLPRSLVADGRIIGIHAADLASYFTPYDSEQIQAALVVNGGNLKGTVKDKSTKGVLSAVSVIVDPKGAQTDQNGFYRIDYLVPGLYTVRFQKAGYYTVDVPANLIMGDNTLNMELEPAPAPPPGVASLYVTVKDAATLSAVDSIVAKLYWKRRDSELVGDTFTDAAGVCSFLGLVPGPYSYELHLTDPRQKYNDKVTYLVLNEGITEAEVLLTPKGQETEVGGFSIIVETQEYPYALIPDCTGRVRGNGIDQKLMPIGVGGGAPKPGVPTIQLMAYPLPPGNYTVTINPPPYPEYGTLFATGTKSVTVTAGQFSEVRIKLGRRTLYPSPGYALVKGRVFVGGVPVDGAYMQGGVGAQQTEKDSTPLPPPQLVVGAPCQGGFYALKLWASSKWTYTYEVWAATSVPYLPPPQGLTQITVRPNDIVTLDFRL